MEQEVGDDEAEHRVAEKLERLVIDHAAADILVGARGVSHGVLEQPAVAEAIDDRLLERIELVAQAYHLAGFELGAVAVDDPACLAGILGPDGDPYFAELVDVQRKHRVRHGSRQHRHDAVRLEQPAYDARFDIGLRAEDDDWIGQWSLSGFGHGRTSAISASSATSASSRARP